MDSDAMPHEDTVFAASALALFGFAMSRGWSCEALLEMHGLDPITDLDARVPYETLLNTWHAMCAREPDAHLGLDMAQFTQLEEHGIIGQLIIHSPNVRTGMERMMRFQRIFDPRLQLTFEEHDAHVVVRMRHEPRVLAIHEITECLFGVVCLYLRRHASAGQVRVQLGHPQRHALARYHEVFGTELSFDHACYEVHLDPALLNASSQGASAQVGRYLELYTERLSRELNLDPQASMEVRVRDVLLRALAEGQGHQEAVARALGVSTRTMQRRLREEGHTFSGLLTSVRRSQAEHLLVSQSLPIYEIAYLLGYAEPSAFYRAFRRWYGVSPEAWRRRE